MTGKIENLKPILMRDKLTVVQVDIGERKSNKLFVVQKNHKQGDHVVGPCGAILPGEFKINKSKIPGHQKLWYAMFRKGVLASESQGILILPQATAVGQSFSDYLGANDIIFELSVTQIEPIV